MTMPTRALDESLVNSSREAAAPGTSDASDREGDSPETPWFQGSQIEAAAPGTSDASGREGASPETPWFQGSQILASRTGFCLVNGRGGCTYATCAAVIAELSRASARGD